MHCCIRLTFSPQAWINWSWILVQGNRMTYDSFHCVSLICPNFIEHICVFKVHKLAKTFKTDSLISNWSVYLKIWSLFGIFLHFWQERLLQIIWPDSKLAVRTQTGSGPYFLSLSTSLIVHYLFSMCSACLAFDVRFSFLFIHIQRFWRIFKSVCNIGPGPVFVKLVLWNSQDQRPAGSFWN